ncbi:MAG TPA: maleylpyruvate isomerase family mycothiol-dependent enzyme [Trebonia sp.]
MSSQTSAAPWLAALNTSSDGLTKIVSGLSDETLARPSFTGGWTIAQVLSHLGSAAEICTGLVRRGIDGDEAPPTADEARPVWQRWDALSARDQREAWFEVDRRHRLLVGSLSPRQVQSVRIPYFAGLLSVPDYAGYRLSEQSIHGWDIDVALDPAATIPAAQVDLLWERLDVVASRFRDAEILKRLAPRQLAVELTDRDRNARLELDADLHLVPGEPADPAAIVSGTAEALLRLVYGRNRPEDGVTVAGDISLEDLRSLFPGF